MLLLLLFLAWLGGMAISLLFFKGLSKCNRAEEELMFRFQEDLDKKE